MTPETEAKKFDNKNAFKIKAGSTPEETTIIFPKKGSVVLTDCEPEFLKPLVTAFQLAFDQGYEKALRDKNMWPEK